MKNPSSYLANITGSFPNIAAQNCTGPGETDGTEIVADLVQDTQLGWIQALMNAAGLSPNGVSESSSASQILDALKALLYDNGYINLATGKAYNQNETDISWSYGYNGAPWWWSILDEAQMVFPIRLPRGMIIDITANILVNPGAVRSSTNRMSVEIGYVGVIAAPPYFGWTMIGGPVYDDGTSDEQTITATVASHTVQAIGDYYIHVTAGNNAAANGDLLTRAQLTWTKS